MSSSISHRMDHILNSSYIAPVQKKYVYMLYLVAGCRSSFILLSFYCSFLPPRLILEPNMPRMYKPKTGARPYNSAPPTSVAQAIDDYKCGGLSQREICQKYGIPRSSFQNHLKG